MCLCALTALNLDLLAPQASQDRGDPAATVLQAGLGTQDPRAGPESPGLSVLLDRPATVTPTRVWATMSEVRDGTLTP